MPSEASDMRTDYSLGKETTRVSSIMLIALFYIIGALQFFIQGGQGYCIYNDLSDGTEIYVYQKHLAGERYFKKWIGAGNKECCPYTNPDCCPKTNNYEPNTFAVQFKFPRYTSAFKEVNCVAGGGLNFRGSLDGGYWAECTDAEGKTWRAEIGELRPNW